MPYIFFQPSLLRLSLSALAFICCRERMMRRAMSILILDIYTGKLLLFTTMSIQGDTLVIDIMIFSLRCLPLPGFSWRCFFKKMFTPLMLLGFSFYAFLHIFIANVTSYTVFQQGTDSFCCFQEVAEQKCSLHCRLSNDADWLMEAWCFHSMAATQPPLTIFGLFQVSRRFSASLGAILPWWVARQQACMFSLLGFSPP